MKALFKKASDLANKDGMYTRKIQVPHYEPRGEKPNIAELCNYKKYSTLLKNINESSVSDEEKSFLKLAASRHIIFNYSKVADYYANASKEMQELMEQSALVILDINDAIANGYVQLGNHIKSIIDAQEDDEDEDDA